MDIEEAMEIDDVNFYESIQLWKWVIYINK